MLLFIEPTARTSKARQGSSLRHNAQAGREKTATPTGKHTATQERTHGRRARSHVQTHGRHGPCFGGMTKNVLLGLAGHIERQACARLTLLLAEDFVVVLCDVLSRGLCGSPALSSSRAVCSCALGSPVLHTKCVRDAAWQLGKPSRKPLPVTSFSRTHASQCTPATSRASRCSRTGPCQCAKIESSACLQKPCE